MRWKTYFAFRKGKDEPDHPDTENRRDKFDFKSLMTPPQVEDELSMFESRLYDMVTNIDFDPQSPKNAFTGKMNNDIKKLRESNQIWISADKTTNFYETDPNTYRKLLTHSLTSQYRKCDELEELRINKNASDIAKELCIDDRTKRFSRQEAFITLKDHKNDFRTNPSTRLIQWRNATEVLE